MAADFAGNGIREGGAEGRSAENLCSSRRTVGTVWVVGAGGGLVVLMLVAAEEEELLPEGWGRQPRRSRGCRWRQAR